MQRRSLDPACLDAIAWARKLLNLPDFVILDTETTGFGADDEIVSIGVIDSTGAVLLDSLVKPGKPIPHGASQIHGIRDRHVVNAPTFADLHPQITSVLEDRVLVVYNLDFDQRILRQCHARHKLLTPRLKAAHCAMKWYARYHGEWSGGRHEYKWQKLAVACQHFGIPPTNAHSAVGDCLLTLDVIRHMASVPVFGD